MYEFKLPDLGEGIHEAEILKWHVETGGTVGEDEPLVDVGQGSGDHPFTKGRFNRLALRKSRRYDNRRPGDHRH